jgi:hypothetical protein
MKVCVVVQLPRRPRFETDIQWCEHEQPQRIIDLDLSDSLLPIGISVYSSLEKAKDTVQQGWALAHGGEDDKIEWGVIPMFNLPYAFDGRTVWKFYPAEIDRPYGNDERDALIGPRIVRGLHYVNSPIIGTILTITGLPAPCNALENNHFLRDGGSR